MKTIELVNLLALVLSPTIAVLVTLFYQSRQEKRARKNQIFTILMANRKTYPITQGFVDALNLIDLVFADAPSVTKIWHEYYGLLASAKTAPEFANRENKYTELLAEMAEHLGYERLRHVDIDKFYSPQQHIDQNSIQFETQTEWLRILKNTSHLNFPPKSDGSRS